MTTPTAPSSTSERTPTTTPSPAAPIIRARSIGAFERPAPGDPTELIKDRFLCKRGSLLLCGGTGSGKSALAVQLPAQFALGKGDFGIEPAAPLKSLIVQSENDDGDIAEFRDGAYAGYGYTGTEIKHIQENVVLYTELNQRGTLFCSNVLKPLLEHHRPHLIWLDHALAYYKGDALSQLGVGDFLREKIAPLLVEYDCAIVILHHTPKPPTAGRPSTWTDRDFSYLGFGSAEWAHWSRAVLTVVEVGDRIFDLRAPKRGERLGWKDDKDKKTTRTHIAWSSDKVFWRKALASELPKSGKKEPIIDPEDMRNIVLYAEPKGLSWDAWWKQAKKSFGGTEKPLRSVRQQLKDACRVYYDAQTQVWRILGS